MQRWGGRKQPRAFLQLLRANTTTTAATAWKYEAARNFLLEQRHKTSSAKAAQGLFTHVSEETPPPLHVPKKWVGRILVGDTTAKTTEGRWMILRLFIKKFLFHEIKVAIRLFLSFYSFMHTTFVSRTCVRLHAAAGPNTRGASQPGNYHQEDKIQGRRLRDQLVAYTNRNPEEGA